MRRFNDSDLKTSQIDQKPKIVEFSLQQIIIIHKNCDRKLSNFDKNVPQGFASFYFFELLQIGGT